MSSNIPEGDTLTKIIKLTLKNFQLNYVHGSFNNGSMHFRIGQQVNV